VGDRPRRRDGARGSAARGLTFPLALVAIGLAVIVVSAAWGTGIVSYADWWLTNTTAPSLSIDTPLVPVRGVATVNVFVGPEGRASATEVTIDGRPLPPAEMIPVDTSTLPDGVHQIAAVAEDRSFRHNRTTATATLTIDNTPPQITLDAEPAQVQQGHTLLLRIRTNELAAVEARIGSTPLDVQAADGYGWALVGFDPMAPTTSQTVTVDGRDTAGNTAEVQQSVEVIGYQLPVDSVNVPPGLADLLAPDVRANEDKLLAPTYQIYSPQKLWDGRFTMPVIGPILTEFGTQRSYNGGPVASYLQGADIAASMGAPVLAPARGRVVLTGTLDLRGNVVVLDHGLGVFTTYGHLSEIGVQLGDMVEPGQAFAKVGNTGLATGSHLQWELWVRGANVDPLEWTRRDIP
jgi:murein DD-endopeptidase MepM/ murein hydrolase activator NlpD